jgi:hypothetical protein
MAQPVQGKEPPQTPMGFLPPSEDPGDALLSDENPARVQMAHPRPPEPRALGERVRKDRLGHLREGRSRLRKNLP